MNFELVYEEDKGMSLRDWFAGMALVGYAQDPKVRNCEYGRIAWMCYEQADSMLKRRNGNAGKE